MKRIVAGVLVTLVLVSVAPRAQELERQLKAAMNTEFVDGDLRAAVDQYAKVAASGNRVLAAQALLRMAECYRKLGDAEAQRTYERIVRDFADQKTEYALARTRLGGRDGRTKSERLVSLDPRLAFPGTVSADGRFVSSASRVTGDVFVRDLTTGVDRLLSKATPTERGSYSVMSRDGRQVAFIWGPGSGQAARIFVASLPGTDAPNALRRLTLSDDRPRGILPLDWSPDGKWLAVVALQPGSGPEIALVSPLDGTVRVLKSMESGRFPRNILFSPDSRYVAYSPDVPGTRGHTRVAVIAIDGASREHVVVDHPSGNHVMGWSPDGSSLLFASDRNGSSALWTLPVREGQPTGDPTQVNADLGPDPVSLGVTASGTLHVWKFTNNKYLHTAPIDLRAGTAPLDATSTVRTFIGGGGKPAWSADGQQLAYYSCTASCNRTGVIKIRTIETEQVRELPFRLTFLQAQTDLIWSPDGRTLTVNATDLNGRGGLHRIDVQNGETQASGGAPLLAFQGTNVTTDSAKAYAAVGGSVVERDVASGKDRVVFQERAPGNTVVVRSSPDRRYTAFVETTTAKTSTLFVMPYGGGEPRELFRATGFDSIIGRAGFDAFGRHGLTWTPDARAILLMAGNGRSRELWLVPVSDGAPRKLDIDVENWVVDNFNGGLTLRPDGRQIAFVAGEVKEEIWALENFLPSASARR